MECSSVATEGCYQRVVIHTRTQTHNDIWLAWLLAVGGLPTNYGNLRMGRKDQFSKM